MSRRTTIARLPAALVVTALAAMLPAAVRSDGNEAELANMLGSRQPGQPLDCLSPLNQTSVQVVQGTAIVYGHGTRLYVNRPIEGASALRQNDVLVANIYREQLCRLDTVTLFDPSSRLPRGVVTLGRFIPYGRPR